MKELEYFHFGEISFHRNDSEDKVSDYCTTTWVDFNYKNFWDKYEEIFQNAQNMTALRRRFKHKITTVGGKGKVAEERRSKKRRMPRKDKRRHTD